MAIPATSASQFLESNVITITLMSNVDLQQGTVLSISGLTGTDPDRTTLEIEGPDSTRFSLVSWSPKTGELKMTISDVDGTPMGQLVVFSFLVKNPRQYQKHVQPTIGAENSNLFMGDSVMSGLVLGAGEKSFFQNSLHI